MDILFNLIGVLFLIPYLCCVFATKLGFSVEDTAKGIAGGTLIYLIPSLLFFWLANG